MTPISIAQVNASTSNDQPRLINQLQQNIIDGISKLQIALQPVTSSIGDTQLSTLTLAQFQAQRGKGWVISDGQNVTGSQYQKITGSATVPDQTMNFTDVVPYIKVN